MDIYIYNNEPALSEGEFTASSQVVADNRKRYKYYVVHQLNNINTRLLYVWVMQLLNQHLIPGYYIS